MIAKEGEYWSGWLFPCLRGMETSSVHHKNETLWSDCHPQGPFSTKTLLPTLLKGFLKCGSNPPHLCRALCKCHTLHRALALQDRLSCCPLMPFPRHSWGSCDTSHISKGRASAHSPLLNAVSNTSFKVFQCWFFPLQVMLSAHPYKPNSFTLTTAKMTCNFCLLFVITICHLSVLGVFFLCCWQMCQAVLGRDEPGALVMEGSKC